jgi:hypothetical protein
VAKNKDGSSPRVGATGAEQRVQTQARGVTRSGRLAAEWRSCCVQWGLTFDMSGGPKGAKRPLGRPLDGGVRFHCGPSGSLAGVPSIFDSRIVSTVRWPDCTYLLPLDREVPSLRTTFTE